MDVTLKKLIDYIRQLEDGLTKVSTEAKKLQDENASLKKDLDLLTKLDATDESPSQE